MGLEGGSKQSMTDTRAGEESVYSTVRACHFFLIFILFLSILFIILFFGSSWLHAGFLQLWRAGLSSGAGGYSAAVREPHYSGLSACIARALGTWALLVVLHGLSCPVARGIFQTRD